MARCNELIRYSQECVLHFFQSMVYLERFLLSDLKEFLSAGFYGTVEDQVDLAKVSCLMPLDAPYVHSTGTQASEMRRDRIEGMEGKRSGERAIVRRVKRGAAREKLEKVRGGKEGRVPGEKIAGCCNRGDGKL